MRGAGPRRPASTAATRPPSTATSARTAGAPLPSMTRPFWIRSDQAIAPPYCSMILTDFIRSPIRIPSTTSIPLVTMPKTVYFPSRKAAGPRQM